MTKKMLLWSLSLCLCYGQVATKPASKDILNLFSTVHAVTMTPSGIPSETLGNGDFLTVGGGKIILQGTDTARLLSAIDLTSKHKVQPFVMQGRGPQEILNVSAIWSGKDYIGVKGLDPFKILCYAPETLKLKKVLNVQMTEGGNLYKIVSLAGGQLLGTGTNSLSKQFTLLDSLGKAIAYDCNYPNDAQHPVQNQDSSSHSIISGLAYQGDIAAHPTENRAIWASYSGAILCFLELQGAHIKCYHEILCEYPTYQSCHEGDSFSAITDIGNLYGGLSVTASEKYCFVLYCGVRLAPVMEESYSKGKHILVFDWSGNPICRMELKRKVSSIAVDNTTGILYGFSTNATTQEPEILQLDIQQYLP